jgi:hypothetical protein
MMPAAQGHAALVGHGDDVVGVNVFQQKADHARVSGARAEEAEAGQAQELFQRQRGQFRVVTGDVLAADGGQVIQRDAQADGGGEIRRAGLESVRRFLVSAVKKSTFAIMSPPPRNGGIPSSNSRRP